jgi:hypothetical protein
VGVFGWALYVTTGSRLKVVQVPSTEIEETEDLLPRLLRPLVRYWVWDTHYINADDNDDPNFKRMHMMLIDGLRRPWWTAVELGSATFQGIVLGPRISSPRMCTDQKIVLVVQTFVMAVAALVIRPFGAPAGNVFLAISKSAALVTALLELVGDDLDTAIEAVNSVAVAISSVELVLTALLLVAVLLPKVKQAVASFYHRLRSGSWNREQQRRKCMEQSLVESSTDVPCELVHGAAAAPTERQEACNTHDDEVREPGAHGAQQPGRGIQHGTAHDWYVSVGVYCAHALRSYRGPAATSNGALRDLIKAASYQAQGGYLWEGVPVGDRRYAVVPPRAYRMPKFTPRLDPWRRMPPPEDPRPPIGPRNGGAE